MILDDRVAALGEGPLWHPGRQTFFWFDILGCRLLSPGREWEFDECVSAAGWVSDGTLLVAGQSALSLFDIDSGRSERLADLEADNPVTRSNDGRADPHGGFWIGTMGIGAEPGAGAIYRYFRGEIRKLYGQMTIPNAICFSPGGEFAYFADTPRRQIFRVGLAAADGWPLDAPDVLIDLGEEGLNPDGAVVAGDGTIWNAQWGAGRVARYGADGRFIAALPVPAPHSTCPAFGGAALDRMIVTTATEGMSEADLAAAPDSGKLFELAPGAKGQAEHRVIL